ncbi:type II toxin-antitoxin system HicB family antitoxin [Patescibacteria group bacterium]|nr:type II toxin-antitoxin system HicB family antitoxin [Patescibacteria group bacterium]
MYTAIYKKVRSGYVAWLEEIPGVLTQGATRAEARTNLEDALREFTMARRNATKRASARGASLSRERLAFV